jgi:predicted alpha/beta hydrolase
MARLYGHLPSWALGPGAQAMPRGVALDWSRWGCTPGYFFGDPAMHAHSQLAAISAPVHLWSVHDDRAYAPAVAVDALAQRFRYAAVQRHHLAPADVGQQAIGHFGMFRSDAGVAIWPRWLDAIEKAAPALRRRA